MSKGRKKTPENVLKFKGTYRADRANKEAPLPDPDSPCAPAWLSKEAREWFGVLKSRIEDIGLASKTYTEMLALAAQRIAEIEELNETIEEAGKFYKTTNTKGDTIYKTRPAISQRNEALRHLQSLLAEFGLSPASINKVKVDKAKQDAENKPFGQFTR
jgi:P27 family predicted phage terminase small subunit